MLSVIHCFLSFLHFYLLHKQEQLLGNYATDLCNEDLHTTITLFTHTAISHKPHWTSLTQPPVFPYLLYGSVNSLIKFPEGECSCFRLLEIAINVSIVVYTHYCCLFILFTFILIVLLLYFLFACLLFFLMVVFLVILNSTIICKQDCLLHCFVFVAFVYNFSVKGCKNKTPASWFFLFVTIYFSECDYW